MSTHPPNLTSTDPTVVPLPPGDAPKPPRRPRRVALLSGLAALVLVLAGALVFALIGGRQHEPKPTRQPSVNASPSPLTGQAGYVGTAVAINPDTDDLTVYDGSVWVTSWKAGAVLRVNPSTRAVKRITVPYPLRIEPGLGSVWIASDGLELTRVDAATDHTTIIPHSDFGERASVIAVGERSVWVAAVGRRSAEIIDPASNRITGRVDLGGPLVDMTSGGSAIFVLQSGDTINVVNEATRASLRKLSVTGKAYGLEYDNGRLYVGIGDTIVPVDVSTGQARRAIEIGGGASYFEVAGGRVWVAYDKQRLLRQFDGLTGREIGSALSTPADALAVNVGPDGRAWVACAGGVLLEVTPNGGSRTAPTTAPAPQAAPQTGPGTRSTPSTPTTPTTAPTFTERIHIVTWWSENPMSYDYSYVHFKAVDTQGRTIKEVLGSDSVRLSDEVNALKETSARRKLVDKLRAILTDAGWSEIGVRPGGEWYEYEFGR